jgi:hypothetical protein
VGVIGNRSNDRIVLNAASFALIPASGVNGICGFPDGFLPGPLEHDEQKHDPNESLQAIVVLISSPTTAKGTGTLTEFEFGHDHIACTYTIDLTATG